MYYIKGKKYKVYVFIHQHPRTVRKILLCINIAEASRKLWFCNHCYSFLQIMPWHAVTHVALQLLRAEHAETQAEKEKEIELLKGNLLLKARWTGGPMLVKLVYIPSLWEGQNQRSSSPPPFLSPHIHTHTPSPAPLASHMAF